MKISRKYFSEKYNIEIQWLTVLCDQGVIPYEVKNSEKRTWILIDESCIDLLVLGKHYVVCPICSKKMACVNRAHARHCVGGLGTPQYCELFLSSHKKSEAQKVAQSECLKERFKTPDGEITRNQIAEASKKFNSNPEVIKRKREISREIQNRPEVKKARSKKSKEMWSNPEFLERKKEYVSKNRDQLVQSAFNARKSLKKTSALHIAYKNEMNKAGLKGFITEFPSGYYHIDEADPFAKIAVEIDGCYWHGCSKCGFDGDKRIMLIDKRKNTYFKNRGWVVIHIKEHELKSNPKACIEMLRTLQEKRRLMFSEKIKQAFKEGSLKVRSLPPDSDKSVWLPISDVARHLTPHKKILHIHTEKESIKVTEDHSVFLFEDKKPVSAKSLSIGDRIVGVTATGDVESLEIVSIDILDPEEKTFDLSVPVAENFVLTSGILAHNTYSVSGVSLDIEKSSKYESMKRNFYEEADKSQELAKKSIKLIRGLKQPRYGIGISSALGPYSKPGVQSRRNFAGGDRGGWS
jgi:very-short-patch-repair endonuclease